MVPTNVTNELLGYIKDAVQAVLYMLVILGEIRLGLAVYRPTAFVHGYFDSWVSS